MKRYFILPFFIFTYLFSTAQTDTTKWLYELDSKYKETVKEQQATMLLKLVNPNGFSTGVFLGQTLNKDIEAEDIQIYKDENYTTPYLKSEFDTSLIKYDFDTIITFDPETFAETMKIVKNTGPVFLFESVVYQLNQSWSIDTSTHQLQSRIQDYAIVDCTFKTPKTLFYLDNKPQGKSQHKSDIIWMKSIHSVRKFNNRKFIQKLLEENMLQHQQLMTNNYTPQSIDYKTNKDRLTSRIDTIITFDKITFEEKTNYAHFIYKDTVTHFHIVQNIYFNQVTKQLETRILAIAPLDTFSVFKEKRKPLFWIVYDENFSKVDD